MGPKVLAWNGLEGRTAGGKSPCGSTFSDHPMDNLTSQLHLLNIEILQILRPLRSAAHEDNPLSSCLSYQAARSYIEMNGLVIFMSQVLSMYGSTSAGMDIGVARMLVTTL